MGVYNEAQIGRLIPATPCYAIFMAHLHGYYRSLRTAAARFGVSALLAAAARFGGGIHERFCSDLFGSVENLWEFLRLTAVSEKVGFEIT